MQSENKQCCSFVQGGWLRPHGFVQEYVQASDPAGGTPALPPAADLGEPVVEMPESTAASPRVSHASTPRGTGRPSGTTSSGGSGRWADDGVVGGSARAPYSACSNAASAQPFSQAPRPLRIAVATSLDSSSAFSDGNGTFPGLRHGGIEQSSVPLSSQQLLGGLKGEGSCTSQSLPIPRLQCQAAPGLDSDANGGSRRGQLIELKPNSGSSARAPANAGSHSNLATQQDPSDAGSTGGSAASAFTRGQTRTASGGSTEMHAMYDGWAPRAAVEAATQHGRATSVLSQGSRRSSDLAPCMRSPQGTPGNSAMTPYPAGSPAVVRRHLRSIAQLLMPPTSWKPMSSLSSPRLSLAGVHFSCWGCHN